MNFDMVMGSEEISNAKPITVDEAKKKLKIGGEKGRNFESKVLERQDGQFTKLMSMVFGWKLQKDGSKKLVSRMPSGKIAFPDKSENLDEIEQGMPYICLVYDRPNEYDEEGNLIKEGREAFAKIICAENEPKIFVPQNDLPVLVWTKENGDVEHKLAHANSFAERMMFLINMARNERKFPSIKIIFRENQRGIG